MKTTISFLVFFTVFSLNAFARDYTQFSLPAGVKRVSARVRYPRLPIRPTGLIWRSLAVSEFGFTIRLRIKRSPFSAGIRMMSGASDSARMVGRLLVGVGKKSVFGMC